MSRPRAPLSPHLSIEGLTSSDTLLYFSRMGTPNPEPEPYKGEAAGEAERSSAAGAPPSADRSRGSAYVPKPDFPEAQKKPRRLWLVALAVALAGGLGFSKFLIPAVAPPPQAPLNAVTADVRHEKVFAVSIKDIDVEKTRQAREALAKGEVTPELASLPMPVREALRDGRMSMFTVRMIDWVEEDGDVVQIAVNGQALGQVNLSHSGAVLTIPLEPGKTHNFTVTAVADGGGGVTFGAQSSAGQMITRVMGVGENETWTISFP